MLLKDGVCLEKINELRKQLHDAIEKGNQEEVLRISKKLDVEIVKYIKKTWLRKERMSI